MFELVERIVWRGYKFNEWIERIFDRVRRILGNFNFWVNLVRSGWDSR